MAMVSTIKKQKTQVKTHIKLERGVLHSNIYLSHPEVQIQRILIKVILIKLLVQRGFPWIVMQVLIPISIDKS